MIRWDSERENRKRRNLREMFREGSAFGTRTKVEQAKKGGVLMTVDH